MHFLGGNVRTKGLKIGGMHRWFEIGVNDFNANTYKVLVKIFEELGVETKPLWDTAAYGSIIRKNNEKTVGQAGYAMDNRWGYGPSEEILEGDLRFHIKVKEFLEHIHKHHDMTMDEFVKWAGLNDTFIKQNLYPRIIGMYYTNGIPPGKLPVRMIISYYLMQEGVGQGQSIGIHHGEDGPDRRYFVGGATKWIEKLVGYLSPGNFAPTCLTHTKATIALRDNDNKVEVIYSIMGDKENTEIFDSVVIAMQAKDVSAAFSNPNKDMPMGLKEQLQRFQYSKNNVTIHSDASLMPDNINAWRTYNINIPENLKYDSKSGNLRYFITYFSNQHQNDRLNPQYNCQNDAFRELCSSPQFFVTVNDRGKVSEDSILAPRKYPSEGLPYAKTGCPEMYRFFHNILDFKAMKAQDKLLEYQGRNNIHLVGGYTKGAGLHEECWLSGWAAAKKIDNPDFEDPNVFNFNKCGLNALPEYMRDLIHTHYRKQYKVFAELKNVQ